jgi:hypothetical protein
MPFILIADLTEPQDLSLLAHSQDWCRQNIGRKIKFKRLLTILKIAVKTLSFQRAGYARSRKLHILRG